MRINRNKSIKCILVLAIISIYIPIILYHRYDIASNYLIKTVCLSSLAIYVFEIWQIYSLTEKIFTPTNLFLGVYYIFQNGQLLLLALGIKFDTFYINTLKEYMMPVVAFSAISNVIAGYVALLTAVPLQKEMIKEYHRKIDFIPDKFIVTVARIGFFITGAISIVLILIKIRYSLSGGYDAVRRFEGYIPSIINLCEYMFMPFAILLISYSETHKSAMVRNVIIIWAVLTALCGDRTTGIGALVAIIYLIYTQQHNVNEKLGKKIISFIFLVLAGILLTVFIQVAYSFRTKGSMDISSIYKLIVNTISDLGFSYFPLFTTMGIVPGTEKFLLGKGYVLSFIGGFIPAFIDVTGTISKINSQSRIFEVWQSKYYSQYSFGLGYSLNAEAYTNFGWYGLIALGVILLVIFKLLNSFNPQNKKDKWGCYRTSILIFFWFTLPRRDSYYIWKAISYSLILMQIYILTMRNVLRKYKY